jgi:hypothetical protein
MKSNLITVVLLLTLFMIGCKSTRDKSRMHSKTDSACEDLLLLESAVDSLRIDPFTIDSAFISGNCLDVYVQYGGGCGEVDFQLYYTQVVAQSMPPQTVLYLECKDDDPCRSIVTRKLSFELGPFKKAASTGGIVFILEDQRVLFKVE